MHLAVFTFGERRLTTGDKKSSVVFVVVVVVFVLTVPEISVLMDFFGAYFCLCVLLKLAVQSTSPFLSQYGHLQPKTAGERLILMPSMDKQRKFQEPLGLLCLS